MASKIVTIRDGVHSAINTKKTALGFIINNFTLTKEYAPLSTLEALETPKVLVIGTAYDEQRITRSPGIDNAEIGVIVGLQRKVSPTDTATMDQLTELYEQLRSICIADNLATFGTPASPYVWSGNAAIKDDAGLPFYFVQLRQNHVYEAYFRASYRLLTEG